MSRFPTLALLRWFERSTLVPIVLIAATVIALYIPFIHNPLVFDDVNILDSNARLLNSTTGVNFELRSLAYGTFGWTRVLPGSDLVWQRIGNMLLHIANGAALFLFLRRLFKACLTGDRSSADSAHSNVSSHALLAFAGALLFVLHPAAVYGVAYLAQRTILMATLFSLLTWLLFLEGLLRGRQSWLLASALCYGFAVFSKEHAIMAPAVAATLVVLISKPCRQRLAQLVPVFAAYGVIAAIIIFKVTHEGVIGRAYEPRGVEFLQTFASLHPGFDLNLAHYLSALTQSTLFFKYLLIWIVPNPLWMSVDMAEPFALSLLSWPYSAGLFCFLLYGAAAVGMLFKRGHTGLLGFAMLAPWLMFATEFSSVRVQESFVIYRSYLWMAGATACLPFVFRRTAPARMLVMLSLLIAVMLPVAWNRLTTFSSELLLWNDAARLLKPNDNRPGVERIYLNRGIAFYEHGSYVEALRDLDRALSIHPLYIEAITTRGAAELALGAYDKATQDFNVAIRLNPGYSQPYLGLGRIYELRHDLDAARNHYGTGCRLGLADACQANARLNAK